MFFMLVFVFVSSRCRFMCIVYVAYVDVYRLEKTGVNSVRKVGR